MQGNNRMSIIGRILVIVFALLVSTIAMGMALAVGLHETQWHAVSQDVGESLTVLGIFFVGTAFTASIGLLPMLLLVIVSEAFRVRSLLITMAAGALLILGAYYGNGLAHPRYEESIDGPPPLIPREAQAAAAAGAIGGFVYWLIAGRNAGRRRERGDPSA